MDELSESLIRPKVLLKYSVNFLMKMPFTKVLTTKLTNYFNSHRRMRFVSAALLIGLLAFSGWMLWGAFKIKTHYSLDQFKPDHHPLLKKDKVVKDRFHITDSLAYVVALESVAYKNWLDGAALKQLNQLTEKVSQFAEVSDIKSLSNVETAIVESSQFTVAPVGTLKLTEQKKQELLKNPLLVPHFVSKDGKWASLLIKTKRLSFKQQALFYKKLDSLVKSHSSLYHGVVGGPAAITAQIAELLTKEIVLYTALSLLVSVLIFAVMFRGKQVLILSSITILAANVAALGVSAFTGVALTVLTSTLPILVTLMTVSIVSQTLARLSDLQAQAKGAGPLSFFMSLKVMWELLPAHLIGALTTAVGFATMMSSSIPVIREYGWSVSLGILVSCLVTIVLFSALMIWFHIPQKRREWVPWPQVSLFVLRHAKPLFVFVLVLTAVSVSFGGKLNWSSLLFDDLPKQNNIRRANELVEKKMGGVVPYEVSIGGSRQVDFWKKPESLQKLNSLTEKWRGFTGVRSVVSASDFIKVATPRRQIASTSKSISETLFVYSMANENPLEDFLTSQNSYARVTLRTGDLTSEQSQKIVSQISADAKKAFPGMRVEVTGLAATMHPINESLSKGLIYDFYSALGWIVLLLLVIFRSWRWTLISVLPNLIPTAILLGILALSQTPIRPSIAMVFAISLGIAFNNTIYILNKLKTMIQGQEQFLIKLPVQELMAEEFGPCFVSSMAVVAGFSVFLFSQFTMNQMFGLYLILSVVAGLLGDLILLPCLLELFPKFLLSKKSNEKLGLSGKRNFFFSRKLAESSSREISV